MLVNSGGAAAYKLFNQYLDEGRPKDLESIDNILKKAVNVVIELEAPIDNVPAITVIK